jgi:hypothetical protein
MKFGQDSHPRGRDPLGHKENKKVFKVGKQRNDKRKSPLSLEVQAFLNKANSKKIIMESTLSSQTLLDESNILDLEN